MKLKGVKHQRTAPHSQQQNGIAERYNRTLVEATRCVLHNAGLANEWWAEAARHVCFVRNRVATKALTDMTPEECWSGVKPSLEGIRTFGCIAFVHVPDKTRTKLEPKARACMLIAMEEGFKGWRFWDFEKDAVIRSRDATFLEHVTLPLWQRRKEDSLTM